MIQDTFDDDSRKVSSKPALTLVHGADTATKSKGRSCATGRKAKQTSINAYLSANRPAIGRLLNGEFEIQSLSEAEKLATMLGSHCPDSELAAIGIWELLSNAIEHGNLEIDYATKSTFLLAGHYQEEIERRSAIEPYRNRVVHVVFRQLKSSIELRIADQGPGFDFQSFGPGFSAADAPNGRGIAIARQMAFSELSYLGTGNIVEATIRRE